MADNNNNQDLLIISIKKVFDNWTAYQLAIAHDFGGSDTREKAEWFKSATQQWIVENPDLETDELEDFFVDTMDKEFNTMIEDDSASQVAKAIHHYAQMYKQDRVAELRAELEAKFSHVMPSQVQSSRKAKNNDNEEDSSSDEDDEQEMEQDDDGVSKREQEKQDVLESKDYQAMDEGWTFVAKSGKHFTK